MKSLAQSVVLVYPDGLGAGQRIASALGSSSSLSSSASEVSLSLESYGAAGDGNVALKVVNFAEENQPMVSVITLLQEPAPGLHACVAHELLRYILHNAPADNDNFTIFVPSAAPFPSMRRNDGEGGRLALKFVINDDLAARAQMFDELVSAPENLHANDEFLACLVHLIRVMGPPAVILLVPVRRVSSLDKSLVASEKACAIQAIQQVGVLLAQWLALSFSSEAMDRNLPESFMTRDARKVGEWRDLYT